MKRWYFAFLLFITLVSTLSPLANATGQDDPLASELVRATLAEYDLTASVFNATWLATIYGFPLTSYANAIARMNLFETGYNKLFTTGVLSAVQDTSVVRENIDTVYSTAILDFSSTDLVLYVPLYEPDRFVSFDFYDPFAFIYGALGNFDGNQSGEYLVKSPSSNSSGCPPQYVSCFNAPTYDGLLQVRVEAKNNNTDLPAVNAYLSNITLTPAQSQYHDNIPPLSPRDFADLPQNDISAILTLVARLYLRNTPEYPLLSIALPQIFAYAGINITNGTFTPQSGADLTKIEDMLIRYFADSESHIDFFNPLNGPWIVLDPSWYGTYDNGRLLYQRAFTAYAGYLGNRPSEAIYPAPGIPSYNISTSQSILITFNSIVPVNYSAGFWSLTLYGQDNFLIPNPENVYGLGNHYNLTYSDGTTIYTPTGQVADPSRSNGTFEILIQAGDVRPPANWTSK